MYREDRDDRAFTGLEAAIVFIAFVVVASVFSYTVLGVGMATSQKDQEVMYAALEEAGSALRPGYTVIAKMNAGSDVLRSVEFDLETATDLAVINMRTMTYTVATKEALVTFRSGEPSVKVSWRCREDTDDLLKAGELVTVTLDVRHVEIHRGDTFTVSVTAAGGATASLTRTVPTGVEENAYIELF